MGFLYDLYTACTDSDEQDTLPFISEEHSSAEKACRLKDFADKKYKVPTSAKPKDQEKDNYED